jgi:hypothetical protein
VKDWPALPEDDLERADALLGQADALLRRHRGGDFRAPEPRPSGLEPIAALEPVALEDDDDLPILTDVVDDFELADLGVPARPDAAAPVAAPTAASAANDMAADDMAGQAGVPRAPAESAAPLTADDAALLVSARAALIEDLVRLDTEIARSVEAWLADEIPQILQRELDGLAERVKAEALAQLRATLLPALSERVAGRIDRLVD